MFGCFYKCRSRALLGIFLLKEIRNQANLERQGTSIVHSRPRDKREGKSETPCSIHNLLLLIVLNGRILAAAPQGCQSIDSSDCTATELKTSSSRKASLLGRNTGGLFGALGTHTVSTRLRLHLLPGVMMVERRGLLHRVLGIHQKGRTP